MARFKLREGLNSFTDPSQPNPDNQCISGKQVKELALTPLVKKAIQNKVLEEVKEPQKEEVETPKPDKK
jgi:hypothetical protein